MDPANLNTYYEDLDGDGYGNDAVTMGACSPTGFFVRAGGDCNDDPNTNGQAFNPGMPDTPYDGITAIVTVSMILMPTAMVKWQPRLIVVVFSQALMSTAMV